MADLPTAARSPEDKVKLHALLAEAGSMTLQSLCILDDLDDKFDETPALLQAMDLSRDEMSKTLRFLRKVSDKARRAQAMVFEDLVGRLNPPETLDTTVATSSASKPAEPTPESPSAVETHGQ